MSSPVLLNSGASRPRSGILTPSSEGSLNRNDVPISPEGRKRKRSDSVAMDHLLKPSIALKPHPPNLHIQPRVLQPLMVLPRENFPLACIDFNASHSDLSQSRLFESHIKILDLESRMGSVPVVLLARNELTRTIYALERQENGLYVACRLGSWVELDQLAKHATAICRDRLRPTNGREIQAQSTSISMTTPQMHKDHKQKRAAIEAIQSLVRKRARSQSVSTFDDVARLEDNIDSNTVDGEQLPSPALNQEGIHATQLVPKEHISAQVTVPEAVGAAESPPRQTADDILESIRTQYGEALYKSLGSLAYFAKGPLSRARSAFHLDLESNLDMGDLIDFLKSLILTTVQIDKKYRETIPEVISKMKTMAESSDEGRKKKRRTRKMKLGKDGLYPYEEDQVAKWWIANKPELKDDEIDVPAQQIKSLTSMLRTRETQLQMILVLEILALEPLRATEDVEESQLPALPGVTSQDQMAPPPPKKRNKHNLPVLVDVHADRLTIWQSTVSDEQRLLEDSQVSRHPGDDNPQKASSEPLKDFCVDVIVPFFSARLPELCDSINRKLGGPVTIQPSKSRGLKRSSSKREQRPGAATQRPAPVKAPRTLQRALSTEQQRRSVSRGPSNMIALMRSATSTSLPSIKREGSEPATLKAMIKAESQLLNKRSGPLSRSSSMTNIQDAKAKKQALVDAELKDAISALRKPNRDVVGKALAEAEERRASSGHSAKKIRKAGRSSLGSSIVKATPANYRFKDVFAGKLDPAADLPLMSTEDVIPPSSVPSMVPSTGLRSGYRDACLNSVSPLNSVGRTPTKSTAASTFLRRPADEPAIPNSPLMERRTVSAEQLLATGQEQRRLSFSKSEGIFATPVKAKASELKDTENLQNELSRKNVSIYQALGWDDEYDDL